MLTKIFKLFKRSKPFTKLRKDYENKKIELEINGKKYEISNQDYIKYAKNFYLKYVLISNILYNSKSKNINLLQTYGIRQYHLCYNNMLDEYYIFAHTKNETVIIYKLLSEYMLNKIYEFRKINYDILYEKQDFIYSDVFNFIIPINDNIILLPLQYIMYQFCYRKYIYKTPVLLIHSLNDEEQRIYNPFTRELIFEHTNGKFLVNIYQHILIVLQKRFYRLVNLINPLNQQLYFQTYDDNIEETCSEFNKFIINVLI